jgi:hypothetical protein
VRFGVVDLASTIPQSFEAARLFFKNS